MVRRLRASVISACLLGLTLLSGTVQADPPRTLAAAEAAQHVGETARVCGLVVSTKFASTSNRQPTFLNLDRPYPNQVFTVVIWGSNRAAFGQPEVTYNGKSICVTGTIQLYKGKAEIIASVPSQIELAGGTR